MLESRFIYNLENNKRPYKKGKRAAGAKITLFAPRVEKKPLVLSRER